MSVEMGHDGECVAYTHIMIHSGCAVSRSGSVMIVAGVPTYDD